MRQGQDTPISVTQLLDEGRFSLVQLGVVILAALAIVLDGFDGQLIGFAIPAILKEFGASRTEFAPIVAIGLVGMGLGSFAAGPFGDRFGRRLATIISVAVFGLATVLIGGAETLWHIGVLRFIAGLGIGGALPSAAVAVAELTPRRYRTIAVTTTIVCVPAGGIFAGLFAAAVLPTLGWRTFFHIGGLAAVVFSLVLLVLLPESPRWLATRPKDWPRLARFLARIGHPSPEGAAFIDDLTETPPSKGFASLFKDGFAASTLPLWAAFFLTLFAVYSMFSWLPTLLTGMGWTSPEASYGLTLYNLGGVVGAVLCAIAITRFGSRWPLIVSCLFSALSAGVIVSANPGPDARTLVLVAVCANGLFVNAVQATLYAVTANLYPTSVRATGSAGALAFGRLGAITSALAGAATMTQWGVTGFFSALAVSSIGGMIALALLPRHIEPAFGVRP